MMTIKTESDIEILKEGGKRHAEILNQLANRVSPGVSALELDTLALHLIREGGDIPAFLNYKPDGAKRPFPGSICISVNDEIVHGIPNEEEKILKEGDIVSIDLGLIHNGMITDAAITLPVGYVSSENLMLIKATNEALQAGIKAAHGGNTIGDIGFAIENVGKKYKLKPAEGLAGHGVGYEVHEDPYVPNTGLAGSGLKLRPGMVLAIEPMFVLGDSAITLSKDGYTFKTSDGKNSAHAEHTVLITEGEAVILTKK